MKKGFIILLLCISCSFSAFAQERPDSLKCQTSSDTKFTAKQLMLPVFLIALGTLGLTSDCIKSMNHNINDEVINWRSSKFHIDDYFQYLPVVSVYGISLFGAKAKHDYYERTAIIATSYLSMGIMVYATKQLIDSPRPDTRANNSFPSGHTATVFMGAELVRREYNDDSYWYGIGAYTIACGVGFLRVYNERHWVTDVLAGAGVGILSAHIGYWLLPLNKKLFWSKEDNKRSTAIVPYYTGQQGGLAFRMEF